MTADEALVLATDDLYREAGYTALSRARLHTRIYVAADDFDNDASVDLTHQPGGREGLAAHATVDRWLRRSRADHFAIDR